MISYKNIWKKIFVVLGLKHGMVQHKWGRKYFGGYWILIDTNLNMSPFWTDSDSLYGAGSRIIDSEYYMENV